ncbi:hypothetical protein BH11ACT3_BH11ACT3_11480 [soil metagenome]
MQRTLATLSRTLCDLRSSHPRMARIGRGNSSSSASKSILSSRPARFAQSRQATATSSGSSRITRTSACRNDTQVALPPASLALVSQCRSISSRRRGATRPVVRGTATCTRAGSRQTQPCHTAIAESPVSRPPTWRATNSGSRRDRVLYQPFLTRRTAPFRTADVSFCSETPRLRSCRVVAKPSKSSMRWATDCMPPTLTMAATAAWAAVAYGGRAVSAQAVEGVAGMSNVREQT